MLLTINKKATGEEIKKMAEDFPGFIKVVVDIRQGILAGRGKRHVEEMIGSASSLQVEKGSNNGN